MSGVNGSRPAFNIGIAMAGAVSGGAYSAGVFDFLIEALDEWQKAKDWGDLVPDHEAFISAMSGTSAGGITAAMGLASTAAGVRAVEEPAVNPNQSRPIKRTLPELYDIWVKKVRLFDSPGDDKGSAKSDTIPALLDTYDIRPGGAPDSLLNSDVLTSIARDGLSAIAATGKKHKFLTDPLHLFLTHTNLDGVPIPIDFLEGDGYTMMMHEGRAHFAVRGIGARDYPPECKWLKEWDDHGININLSELRKLSAARSDQPLREPFESYAQAALTTSAFPFGFSARRVIVNTAKTRVGALPFAGSLFTERLKTQVSGFYPRPESDSLAHYVCVDGGALNNEPFEIVRWAIKHSEEGNNVRDPERASRAVILIAPFPPAAGDKAADLAKADRDISLGKIGRALVPALLNQARFKASDLIAASDPNVYSRYLISPKRAGNSTDPALASTSLYAFGGFLDEQFREHDFQLGRRNCQWFLRKHFTLDQKNPVFGADARRRFSAVEPADPKFRCDPTQWPIIPLVGTAAVEVPEPEDWPKFAYHKLRVLREALRKRLDLLAASYTAQFFGSYAGLRSALRISWWHNRTAIVDAIMQVVHDQLRDFKQLGEPAPQTLMERLSDIVRRPWVVAGAIAAMFFVFIVYQMLTDQMTP